MAYVPSFNNDVFISYAHADDSSGRVTDFHRDLVARLIIRLGGRAFHKPDEWIFFDRSGLRAGDELSPKLERAARRSAVMISLISPSYLQAPWCIREVNCFLESQRFARDPIKRRLIPILVNPFLNDRDLAAFPHLAHDLLRGSLCSGKTAHAPGGAEWSRILDDLADDVANHLREAREKHGAVYIGEAYTAVDDVRAELIEELRGFQCIPTDAVFSEELAVRRALAEAKLAVHFLGDSDAEAGTRMEAILWSLEHCQGKTVGYLAPGRQLTGDEKQLVEEIRSHPDWAERWTQPVCTPTELAQILTRQIEGFLLPEPATPLALACDGPDLSTVHGIARDIQQENGGGFIVETPDFLAEPRALPFMQWRKLLARSKAVVIYWGQGRKEALDSSVTQFLPAAKLGRAWFVPLAPPDEERKRNWQPPPEPAAEKIVDQAQLAAFLARVRERAGQ